MNAFFADFVRRFAMSNFSFATYTEKPQLIPRLSIFLLSCQHIFSLEKAVYLIKRFTAAANALQHLMAAKATINPLDHAAGDIGAMIADPFKIIQKIGPDEACFNSTGSLLHTADMARAKFLFKIINPFSSFLPCCDNIVQCRLLLF